MNGKPNDDEQKLKDATDESVARRHFITGNIAYEENPYQTHYGQPYDTTGWGRPFEEDDEESMNCDCLVRYLPLMSTNDGSF